MSWGKSDSAQNKFWGARKRYEARWRTGTILNLERCWSRGGWDKRGQTWGSQSKQATGPCKDVCQRFSLQLGTICKERQSAPWTLCVLVISTWLFSWSISPCHSSGQPAHQHTILRVFITIKLLSYYFSLITKHSRFNLKNTLDQGFIGQQLHLAMRMVLIHLQCSFTWVDGNEFVPLILQRQHESQMKADRAILTLTNASTP